MIAYAYRPIGVRDFTTHPLRKVRTPEQEFKAFCKEIDAQIAAQPMSAEDAALLARLEAMPRPAWMQAVENYETHAQRMARYYRELDKAVKPLTWQPITADRIAFLTNACSKCNTYQKTGKPCAHKDHRTKRVWSEKRRADVVRTAMARGDAFSGGIPGPELMP